MFTEDRYGELILAEDITEPGRATVKAELLCPGELF